MLFHLLEMKNRVSGLEKPALGCHGMYFLFQVANHWEKYSLTHTFILIASLTPLNIILSTESYKGKRRWRYKVSFQKNIYHQWMSLYTP